MSLGPRHQPPLDLVRNNGLLVTDILRAGGYRVPAGTVASVKGGDLTSALPVERRADELFVVGEGPTTYTVDTPDGKLAVVAESQTEPEEEKRWNWPGYVGLASSQERCDSVLVVLCGGTDRSTGQWARRAVKSTRFKYDAIIVDQDTTPEPTGDAATEKAVLGCLTGAIHLDDPAAAEHVASLVVAANLETDRLRNYTHFIRLAAAESPRAWSIMETLMTTTYKDEWLDRIEANSEAKGEAKGKAETILEILDTRGLHPSGPVRDAVMATADLDQLRTWTTAAITSAALEEVFGRDWIERVEVDARRTR